MHSVSAHRPALTRVRLILPCTTLDLVPSTCSASCWEPVGNREEEPNSQREVFCSTNAAAEPYCSSCHNGCGCAVSHERIPELEAFSRFPIRGTSGAATDLVSCDAMCLTFDDDRFDRTACFFGLGGVAPKNPAVDPSEAVSLTELGQQCAAYCSQASFDSTCSLTCIPGLG